MPDRRADAIERQSERSDFSPADPPTIAAGQFRPLDSGIVSEAIPTYYVGQNRDGFWVARNAEGRFGGIFLFKNSALWFAKTRSRRTGCATIFLSDPFELDLKNRGNPFIVQLAPLVKLATRLKRRLRNCRPST